jgi:hypothetical protein
VFDVVGNKATSLVKDDTFVISVALFLSTKMESLLPVLMVFSILLT